MTLSALAPDPGAPAPHSPALSSAAGRSSAPWYRVPRSPAPACILLLALAAAASAVLTACGGSSSSQAAAPAAKPLSGLPVKSASGTAFGAAGSEVAPRAPALPARLVLSAQSIVYTAQLTMRVKDVTTSTTAAAALATGAGGYVAGRQETIPRGRYGTPQATLVLKIPVASYAATLARLSSSAIGRQLYLSQHAQDVTQQVADVGSRVASAQAAIRQLRALLSHAGTVGELLSVQDEINAQESSLESLLAQQRVLAKETSYGTVTVTLLGGHVAFVHHRKKSAHGFVAGLRSGWHALVAVVTWLLTALGAVVPFAVPVAAVAAVVLMIRRRRRRTSTPAGAGPPATAAT